MDKPIIATNIDGLLIRHKAFIEPHKAWFDRAIKLTGDKSLSQWKGHKDYFKGVNIAMEKIMSNASTEQKNTKARTWYQEDVIEYIKTHHNIVYKQVVNSLRKLKDKYRLALVTTNTKKHTQKILSAAGIKGLYDIIYSTVVSEEPKKRELFKRFVKDYGHPLAYIAGTNGERFSEFLRLGTFCVYLALEEINPKLKEMASETITKPNELKIAIAKAK